MNTVQVCQHCGKLLTAKAVQGLCAECFMKVGLGTEPAAQSGSSAPAHVRASRFSPPAVEELAAHFPQLQVVSLIGHGGMGAVYKARQLQLDRLVALKILPTEVSRDPGFAERFMREARALARLSHPNIVMVHDFGQTGGFYYFLMEFVEGVNLREMLCAHRLSPREAMAIVPQICEALQFAHERSIVHRDIKPENILVDKQGRAKIADFGIAKMVGGASDRANLTGQQQVIGTPHYMAPEQIENPQHVDHRADIYSLGVVFYELLTGELPLGKFASPSRKVQVDVRLDEVVLRTLEKEPARRYQRASEVKGDVETIATESAHAISVPPGTAQPRSRDDQQSAAKSWGRVTTCVVVLVTAVLAGLLIRMSSTKVQSRKELPQDDGPLVNKSSNVPVFESSSPSLSNAAAIAARERIRIMQTDRAIEAATPESAYYTGTFSNRSRLASHITSFPKKDRVLATLARDAAVEGDAAVVGNSLKGIVSFVTRDSAARDAARSFVKQGMRAEALAVAKTITDFRAREEALMELTQ